MEKKLNFEKEGLYFLPLGGSGEIGMNLNVYVCQGKVLIVDVGVTFDTLPGVDVLMPDVRALKDLRKQIQGIVLTHAHEDHIGAIAYLWEALGKVPIYATPFTAEMVRHKLKEWGVKAPVTPVPLSGNVTLGPFKVTFISLTHSIPEPNALAIETPLGTILHTGDWKIDENPLIGGKTDVETLKAFGKKGVLAMVSDSTSVFERGWSGSEKTVQETLIKEVQQHTEGRVVIACFASNVARLLSCYEAAKASGRQLGIVGRSFERIDQVARSCGYFENIPPFLRESDVQKVDRKRILIASTGSQGESRAALMRMAYNQHPRVKLEKGDVVIFSSRIIPGNEKSIFELQNQLVRRGIQLITHKEVDDIHVSGHPSEDELIQMYNWVKPQKAVPVHGEDRHLQAHVNLAKRLGVKEAIAPRNGWVIQLAPGSLTTKWEMHSGRLALDGHRLIPTGGEILSERSHMMNLGFVQIALAMTSGGKLKDAQVTLWGLAEPEEREDLTLCVEHAIHHTLSRISSEERADNDALSYLLRQSAKKVMNEAIGKKPFVSVQVLRV